MVASALALTRLIRKHECRNAVHSPNRAHIFREKSAKPSDGRFVAKRVQRFLIDDAVLRHNNSIIAETELLRARIDDAGANNKKLLKSGTRGAALQL
jgi:hypothetical protein